MPDTVNQNSLVITEDELISEITIDVDNVIDFDSDSVPPVTTTTNSLDNIGEYLDFRWTFSAGSFIGQGSDTISFSSGNNPTTSNLSLTVDDGVNTSQAYTSTITIEQSGSDTTVTLTVFGLADGIYDTKLWKESDNNLAYSGDLQFTSSTASVVISNIQSGEKLVGRILIDSVENPGTGIMLEV